MSERVLECVRRKGGKTTRDAREYSRRRSCFSTKTSSKVEKSFDEAGKGSLTLTEALSRSLRLTEMLNRSLRLAELLNRSLRLAELLDRSLRLAVLLK